MTAQFVHLHIHSEYSLQDGIIRVDDLIEQLQNQNSMAVALTDLSTLFSMVKFYQAAEDAGIKPIVGTDIWIENEADSSSPYRLLLLCQNELGYRHLINIVSKSYIEGQIQGRPIVRKEWLNPNVLLGLIAIAPCLESDIATALLDQQQAAETLVEYWLSLFPNRFYLEVTRLGRLNESVVIQALVELAEQTGCPLVATNAVRFLEKDDFEAHEARVCIHSGHTLDDRTRSKQYTEEQYLKTPKEMEALFFDLPEALENSVEIAKRCTLKIKLGQVFLPNYPVPKGITVDVFLSQALWCPSDNPRYLMCGLNETYCNNR